MLDVRGAELAVVGLGRVVVVVVVGAVGEARGDEARRGGEADDGLHVDAVVVE